MQQSQNLSAPGQTQDANAMAAALCFKESYQPAGTCDAVKLTSAEDRQQIREVGRNRGGGTLWAAFKALHLHSQAARCRSPLYWCAGNTRAYRDAPRDNCLPWLVPVFLMKGIL